MDCKALNFGEPRYFADVFGIQNVLVCMGLRTHLMILFDWKGLEQRMSNAFLREHFFIWHLAF